MESIGKRLLGPNGGSGGNFEGGGGNVKGGGGNDRSCSGNNGRGGSMAGRVGAGGGEVKGGGVYFGVSKSLLGDNLRVVIGESGGDTFGVDGGTVWFLFFVRLRHCVGFLEMDYERECLEQAIL
ncbi:hypothetical protein Tco_0905550 [Tanacetum coccineum]